LIACTWSERLRHAQTLPPSLTPSTSPRLAFCLLVEPVFAITSRPSARSQLGCLRKPEHLGAATNQLARKVQFPSKSARSLSPQQRTLFCTAANAAMGQTQTSVGFEREKFDSERPDGGSIAPFWPLGAHLSPAPRDPPAIAARAGA
jgi:hypothetical protein